MLVVCMYNCNGGKICPRGDGISRCTREIEALERGVSAELWFTRVFQALWTLMLSREGICSVWRLIYGRW